MAADADAEADADADADVDSGVGAEVVVVGVVVVVGGGTVGWDDARRRSQCLSIDIPNATGKSRALPPRKRPLYDDGRSRPQPRRWGNGRAKSGPTRKGLYDDDDESPTIKGTLAFREKREREKGKEKREGTGRKPKYNVFFGLKGIGLCWLCILATSMTEPSDSNLETSEYHSYKKP